MPEVSVLKVSLDNENVGTLTWLGGEKSVFSFTEDYINNAERSVLSLSFKDIHGDLITDHRPYKMKLMPFFSNLLPEGHLRRYLAQTVDIHPDREFFLMWVLGRDLPGAVRIEPTEGNAWPPLPPAPDEQKPDYGDVLRFSLAGVQLKFSAVGDKAGGLTIPAHGVGGDHIVKLPSAEYRGVPENEYSMMALARQVGIDVPAIGLVEVDQIANLPAGIDRLGDKAFTIERFDRAAGGERVHIEDFAQIFGIFAEDKYKRASAASIARVIAAETEGADIAEFIRRLTFNTLIGNGDMHLKNWSLIYPDGKRARLAPAYDFVSTIPYMRGDRSALNFSRSKDFADYTVDELEHLAVKASLPRRLVLDAAQETVELFLQAWKSTKADLPMSKDVTETIDAHLETLPIAEGR